MKKHDEANEVSAIKTLCGLEDVPRTFLLGKINEHHFDDARTREMYKVIMGLARKRDQLPTYKMLAQARQLSDDARELLLQTDDIYPPAATAGDAEQIFDTLEKLRVGRILYTAQNSVLKELAEDDPDVNKAMAAMEKALIDARNFATEETLKVGGEDSNITEAVEEAFNQKASEMIPTGFRAFDERAGGLPRGGLTVLAATSNGGKSCMGLQLAVNAVNKEYSVAIVTLEMTKKQMTNRLISNIAEIDHSAVNLAKTSATQQARAKQRFKAWDDECKKKGVKLTIHSISDITMSEIALQMRVFKYDMVIIDHINLMNLEDMDEKNEAKALGDIAKMAKNQAVKSNTAWVVLAQLNEQGLIKYSRAIFEHADVVFTWVYEDEQKETHMLEIIEKKNRNAAKDRFILKENFKIQRLENPGSNGENKEMPGVSKKKKQMDRHPTAKPMPGLEFSKEEDEDDI